MERTDLILPELQAPLSIYTSALPLSEAGLGVEGWRCGVTVHSQCRCEPKMYPARTDCEQKDAGKIGTNWPDGTVVNPVDLGFARERPPKISDKYPCRKWEFNAVKIWDSVEDSTMCFEQETLDEAAANIVGAFSNRLTSTLLMGSSNGNPGLAVVAEDINPGGDKVSDCVGFGALHQNFHGHGHIVVPWQAVGQLVASNLIVPITANGGIVGYQDVWGYPVIVDSGLTGLIGPPQTTWDQTSPIDPATDLQIIDPVAEPGCAWVYITPPVWVGRSDPNKLVAGLRPSASQMLGNFREGFAEAEIIAVFSPCNVKAVKIEVNKGLNCG